MHWIWRLICTVLIAGLLGPFSAAAQGTPADDDVPAGFIFQASDSATSWFDLQVEAGSTVSASALLGTDGDEPVAARTYVADAFTLVNGGFGAGNEGDPLTGPSTWVDFPLEDLTLQPGKIVERTLTVTVPTGIAPGQYLTSVVVQTAEPQAIQGSDMLRQTLRKALAVLITVPGPVEPAFEIGDISMRHLETSAVLVVGIENSGNVLVKPAGTVTLRDAAGTDVVQAPVAMGSVYARTSTTLEVPIPSALEPGTYTVEVSLEDTATGIATEVADVPLEVMPGASVQPVTVEAFTVEPVSDAGGNLQVANVSVSLANAGAPVPAARLTMTVLRDGELVEEYVVNPSLAIASGPSEVQQRYVPITGWETGTYSFSLRVEIVDLATGQSTLVTTVDAPTAITVP